MAARITPALASAVFGDLLDQHGQRAMHELLRYCHVLTMRPRMLQFPWDIVEHNASMIATDMDLLDPAVYMPLAQHPQATACHAQAIERILVHPNAQFEAPVALDAREGPIVIGAARIEPFSVIQGPVAIHDGALISGHACAPGQQLVRCAALVVKLKHLWCKGTATSTMMGFLDIRISASGSM